MLLADFAMDVSQASKLAFQALFVPICAILAIRAMVRTWKKSVPRRAGLLATMVWGGAALAIAIPKLTLVLANAFGIDRGTDLIFYVSMLGGIGIAFYYYNRFRKIEILITELVRRDTIAKAVRCGPVKGQGTAADAGQAT
jgi:hypothetical protein